MRVYQKVDTEYLNQSSTYYASYEKGFDLKKKKRIYFETAHTKYFVSIKTGFTCIKKSFSNIKVNFFFCASAKKTKPLQNATSIK